MSLTIPVNRKRIPYVLICSCILIAVLAHDALRSSAEPGIFNWMVSVVLILVLSFYAVITLIEYLKTLFDRNALLIITDTSITDNLSIFSCGKVLWEDITEVEIRKTNIAEFLIIKVQDPSKYFQNKNIIQRLVIKRYIKKTGGPVVISSQRIKYDLHELRKIVLENKYALKPLDEIIEQWKYTNLKLNEPATMDLINDTEQKIGFHFPADFTNFYLKVNGFKDWDMTTDMFCIWTLERIAEEVEKSDNRNFIPFCDYLIDSHRIGYLKDEPGVYKDYYDDETYKIADTFEETIKLIVKDSGLLY